MQAQFEKYKRLLGDKDNAKELNLTGDHKNYLGSTWSMRFGKVVGDALGLDPVFGSLLSPAGGLVGAGNSGFQASDDNFIGYHGTFHDAGGYLLNTHGVGPGYDYLGEESFRASSNPLTGQRSGVEWWIQQSGTDIPYLPDALARNPLGKRVIGVGSQIYEAGTSVVQAGQGAYGGVKNIFKGNWSEAGRDFSSAGKNIAALPGRAIDAAVDNTVDLLKDAGGYIKDVGGAIGSLF